MSNKEKHVLVHGYTHSGKTLMSAYKLLRYVTEHDNSSNTPIEVIIINYEESDNVYNGLLSMLLNNQVTLCNELPSLNEEGIEIDVKEYFTSKGYYVSYKSEVLEEPSFDILLDKIKNPTILVVDNISLLITLDAGNPSVSRYDLLIEFLTKLTNDKMSKKLLYSVSTVSLPVMGKSRVLATPYVVDTFINYLAEVNEDKQRNKLAVCMQRI